MKAAKIRNELLHGNSKDLRRRRTVLTLSAIGLVDFAFISLYQSGVIKHMPDLPFKIFDSNKVNIAEDAYQMGAPDAPISALAYAGAMVLSTWGGSETAGRKPVHDVALGAVVAGNAVGAVYYLANMIFKQKKICLYCVVGAAINIASSIIIAPTVSNSLKKLSN